jgi:hypothetical protein
MEDALNAWVLGKVVSVARAVAGSPAVPITSETHLRELSLPPTRILQLIRDNNGLGDQGSDKMADDIRTIGDLVGHLSARVFPDAQVEDDDPEAVTSACNPFLAVPAPFDAGLLSLAY